MKSLGAMITQLAGLLGTSDLSPWEHKFVADIDTRTGPLYSHSPSVRHTVALSPATVEKIEQIYSKHFGDGTAA